MTSPSSLLALEGKLVEAKEGSRPLDGALWAVAHGSEWQYGDSIELPRYTSSIDSALALVSRCLAPLGFVSWGIDGTQKGFVTAWVAAENEKSRLIEARAETQSTPAIAICLALVRALKGAGE